MICSLISCESTGEKPYKHHTGENHTGEKPYIPHTGENNHVNALD